ncbi:zinc metalloprotease HtpX [Virgibacillus dakarensis]|uniref:Protease HtpX homolog n=1 Tax=Lentibacillus populi TaxID=1827502 RepID=A0A9W5U0A7_9BACI|nr:zinc metalloprotease HtpX [Lentibacillus populi]MBT2216998.1 zinc metalloprotease HtpX [Virgibacillus dakarensis]MTW86937.1 zinc metalloprotease HtpX [Virgibacillus dakarensis]GGB52600.1 protease HtpX [Lentibacillus populi]
MLYKQILQNKRKTILLVTVFSVLVLVIGWAIGYLFNNDSWSGLIITLIILAFYVPITYMSATSQVLSMSGAKEIKREDNPQLFDVVEELSLAARIPVPKVYIVNDPAPNAFATGIKPEKSAVAFTTGLLDRLNREELSGVAAHEISHIRNYDIRLMTLCIALVGVIVLIAHFGSRMLFFSGGRRGGGGNKKSNPILMIIALVFVILAPIAAQFVQLAVSRNREYLADASAVEITRNPKGLINALTKISQNPRDVKNAKEATASMYIARPLGNKRKKRGSLWATHPPIESRIERLENM